jgi:hypothetical protein
VKTPVVELKHYPVHLTPELLKASQRRTEASGETRLPPLELVPLSKENVETLLDWLEAEGFQGCEVRLKAGKGFAIRINAPGIV